MGISSFEPEGAGERDLRHVQRASHQRMVDLQLPKVGHASAAVCFVLEDRGRALVRGPLELAAPYGEPVQQASRQGFETTCLPRLLPFRRIEGGFALEVIEVGTDESRFFQRDAVVTAEIGHATGGIDMVVRTVRDTRLCDEDLDSVLQSLLEKHDPYDARVGRGLGDVELHVARIRCIREDNVSEVIVYDGPEDRCFGCGQQNEQGLRLKFRRSENGHVEADYVVPESYGGAPGVVHGGIQAVLLDEVLGVTAHQSANDGRWKIVTADFRLRYRRPTPTGKPLKIRGRLARVEGRDYFLEGEIVDSDGATLTTAEARWRKID